MTILPHIVKVTEDKGLILIKATGNDVLGILVGQFVSFFRSGVPPQELFIISQLNHQGDVKDILQPPGINQIIIPVINNNYKLLLY